MKKTPTPADEWLRRSPFCLVRGPKGYFLCNSQGKTVTDYHTTREAAMAEKMPGARRPAPPASNVIKAPRPKRSIHCRRCGGILGPGEHGVHRGRCVRPATEATAAAPVSRFQALTKRVFGS